MSTEQLKASPFDRIDNYQSLIAHNLTEIHGCPTEVCAALMSDYEDEISAMFKAGIAVIGPAKLLYAEWKVFRSA